MGYFKNLKAEWDAPTFAAPKDGSVEVEHGTAFVRSLMNDATLASNKVDDARETSTVEAALRERLEQMRSTMNGDQVQLSNDTKETLLAELDSHLPELAKIPVVLRDLFVQVFNRHYFTPYFHREAIERDSVNACTSVPMYFNSGTNPPATFMEPTFGKFIRKLRRSIPMTRRRKIPFCSPEGCTGLIGDKLITRITDTAPTREFTSYGRTIQFPKPSIYHIEQAVAESFLQRAGVPLASKLEARRKSMIA